MCRSSGFVSRAGLKWRRQPLGCDVSHTDGTERRGSTGDEQYHCAAAVAGALQPSGQTGRLGIWRTGRTPDRTASARAGLAACPAQEAAGLPRSRLPESRDQRAKHPRAARDHQRTRRGDARRAAWRKSCAGPWRSIATCASGSATCHSSMAWTSVRSSGRANGGRHTTRSCGTKTGTQRCGQTHFAGCRIMGSR